MEKKEETKTRKSNQRHYYSIDVLRIVTCLFVVLTHVCCYGIVDSNLEIPKSVFSINDFQIYNFFVNLCAPAVVIFVMISGSFMLDPNVEVTKEVLKKHIVKVCKLLVIFSAFGAVLNILFLCRFGSEKITIMTVLESISKSSGHLWYLYLIFGLYIFTPILRRISSNDFSLNEFIIIGFFVNVVVETINTLFPSNKLNLILTNFDFKLVSGYTLYYLLGYKIKSIYDKRCCKISNLLVFSLYIFSLIISVLLSSNYRIVNSNYELPPYTSDYFITTFFEALSLFWLALFVLERKGVKNKKMVRIISSFTTGIYCFHFYVISYLLKFFDFNFPALIKIFILSFTSILFSIVGVVCLRKVKLFKDIL